MSLTTLRIVGSRRKTGLRTTQVDDTTWEVASKIAAIRGDTLAGVMRDAVKRYVARHRYMLDTPADASSKADEA